MLCCGSSVKKDMATISSNPSIGRMAPIRVVSKDGFQLVQVQIIFRHGARTPLNFTSGLPEATYERHLGLDLPEANIPHQAVSIRDGRPAGPSLIEQEWKDVRLKGGCRPSVLTTVGQKEMLNIGRKIKDTYLSALHIQGYTPDLVSFRSSHIDRTIKSLKCVLVGIFGKITLSKLGPLRIPVKDIWDEDIFPNKLSCPSLRLDINLILANLDKIENYSQDRNILLRALGLGNNATLDFSCLKDDIASRLAHGQAYPKIVEAHRDRIETQAARVLRAVTTGHISGIPPRDAILIMSIGRFLNTILTDMEDVVCGVLKPRLYLYSGHDTTLTPLLEVLGLLNDAWPPFASCLILELYRSRDLVQNNQFFVRVVYNWEEQVLPCHPESVLVPFAVFRSLTSRYTLTPGEFRRMCSNAAMISPGA